MHLLITTGPTREAIDSVRFISNASSGQMGCAVAAAALATGHTVTLLAGPGVGDIPAGATVERFVSVDDLKSAVGRYFDACDVLVMTAAVGDFRVDHPADRKLSRKAGPLTLQLIPTEDILAGIASQKRPGQRIVAFAVEDGSPEEIETKARREMHAKGADLCVVNTPSAMGSTQSDACILTPTEVALAWGRRDKRQLADELLQRLMA